MRAISKNITTVFVDCFDTVIFRREHPFSVFKDWARQMHELYPQLEESRLYELRMRLHRECASEASILEKMSAELPVDDKESFKVAAHSVEIWRECAVQFLNQRMVQKIKEYKEAGLTVYCVSDYHLPADDLRTFLDNLGEPDLFDDIYVSSEMNATKAGDGRLYDVVLSKLGIKSEEVLMIGDNPVSDRDNAAKRGIATYYIPNKCQHVLNAVERRRHKKQPDSKILDKCIRQTRKASPYYEEYIVLFYVFIDRLYRELRADGARSVVFLAREGYFLKELFDIYQEMKIPAKERISSSYFKCSRRAIYSVQKEKKAIENFESISIRNYLKAAGFSGDEARALFAMLEDLDIDIVIDDFPNSKEADILRENPNKELLEARFQENVAAFGKYVEDTFKAADRSYLVDVGWSGRMQHGIANYLRKDVKGYYIGIMSDTDDEVQSDRKGLIFHHTDSEGKYSSWYHFLRVNTMLYEMLLAAPHGSAQHYKMNGDKAEVVEEWDENEKNLYETHIALIQERMLKKFRNLCTSGIGDCDTPKVTEILAKMTWHSAMYPTKARVEFLDTLCEGFSQNFGQQESKLKFNAKSVSVGKRDLVFHAETSARYFAKLPLAFLHKGKFGLYPILGAMIHRYTLITRKR